MASITMVSASFWGNVMPFVPIGNELAARGHDVTFAVPEALHPDLGTERFTLAPLGSPLAPAGLYAHPRYLAQAATPTGAARAGRFWLGEFVVKHLPTVHETLMAATERADLVLTHPVIGMCARMVAEVRGLPWVTGHLFPMMLPSLHHLPDTTPLRRPGRAPTPRQARWAWRLATAVSGLTLHDRRINEFRRSLGLAPARSHVLVGGLSPTDVLVLSSPRYTPVLPDWPPSVRVTGFTPWPGPTGAGLPPGLAEHLADGDPPVLVTIGSAAAGHAGRLLDVLVGAVDRLGVRAVFLVGGPARDHPALRHRTDVWRFAPLPPVLARCRAAVHPAGHGTTAAVLIAGVPSVAVPQIVDQRWHARRIEQLGVGLAVERAGRRPAGVEAALRRILDEPSFAGAARRLAAALAGEDGPAAAADAIEARLTDRSPPPPATGWPARL